MGQGAHGIGAVIGWDADAGDYGEFGSFKEVCVEVRDAGLKAHALNNGGGFTWSDCEIG